MDDSNTFYYCSKKVKFPKTQILELIIELFDIQQTESLFFYEVYVYLQRKLMISNVNRANLLEFLKPDQKCINKSAMLSLYENLINEQKQNLISEENFRVQAAREEKINAFRNSAAAVHADNLHLRIKYFSDEPLVAYLNEKNILSVQDLLRLTDEDILQLNEPYYSLCMKLMSDLAISVYLSIRTEFESVVQRRKPNGKTAKDWEKCVEILLSRSTGATLQDAGRACSLTREGVRQIEVKYDKYFHEFRKNYSYALSSVLKSFSHNILFIEAERIHELIGEYHQIFSYLLKRVDDDDMTYIEELDIFTFDGDYDWYGELLTQADSIPDTLNEQQFNEIIIQAHDNLVRHGLNVPYDFVKTVLQQDFSRNGTFFSRSKISITKKCNIILEKYFPDGIFVYDEEQLNKFREYGIKIFKADELPHNNRALEARIIANCILCDRGKYVLKREPLISKNLLSTICEYIDSSPKEIFLTNTIFELFKEEFLSQGINNKYFLQGILHDKCPDKYYFKKDYVSKSKELTSVYSSVIEYIRGAKKAVSKDEIIREFPGITPIVYALISQDENIITGYCVYLHKDSYIGKEAQVQQLRNIVRQFVADGAIHSSKEFFTYLARTNEPLIDDLYLNSHSLLLGVMKIFFQNDLSFDKPYFAQKNVFIDKKEWTLLNFTLNRDEIEIDEIIKYAREKTLSVYSVLSMLNSLNDEYAIKNDSTLIRWDKVGFDEGQIEDIEQFIDRNCEEGFCVLTSETNFVSLPQIAIAWSNWLLYSILNKYSNKYSLFTTTSQFRTSEPIFCDASLPVSNKEELIEYLSANKGLSKEKLETYIRNRNLLRN